MSFSQIAGETAAGPDAAGADMPVLALLTARFRTQRPLVGRRVAALVNVTAEAVAFVGALGAAGADLLIVSSKTTTYDARAAERMTERGARVLAEPVAVAGRAARELMGFAPELVLDNGDLTELYLRVHESPVLGGTVHSHNALKRVSGSAAELPFPVLVVAQSPLKSAVETPYGTGQAAVRGVIDRGVQLAGKRVLVLGYGMAGRAVADFARGCHARVAVTETAPLAALQAVYHGYELVALADGLADADVVISVTDSDNALTLEHLSLLKDGAVVGGIGHSATEIDRAGLARVASEVLTEAGAVRYLIGGRWLSVLEGPGGNHVYAGINPPEMMDLSFALHALCLVWLAESPPLPRRLLPVPPEINAQVALAKLTSLGLAGALS